MVNYNFSTSQGYGDTIDDPSVESIVPPELKGKKKILLGNLEEILLFHRDQLLPEMINNKDDALAIGDLFTKRVSFSVISMNTS